MRISDWRSDGCSSDLHADEFRWFRWRAAGGAAVLVVVRHLRCRHAWLAGVGFRAQREFELLVAAFDVVRLDIVRKALVAIAVAVDIAIGIPALVSTTVLAATLEATTMFHWRLVQASLFR